MKKKAIQAMLAIAVGALVTNNTVSAADDGGFYLDGRVGSASVDVDPLDDRDTAIMVGGGYRWGWFGVEAGYADFGTFEDSGVGANGRVAAELDGFILGVTARTNFGDSPWYVAGRAGAFVWSLDGAATLNIVGTPTTFRGNGLDRTDWYAGVGVGYDFSDRWSVGVAYDRFEVGEGPIDDPVDTISATVEVRF